MQATNKRVKIIILLTEDDDDEVSESMWLHSASVNPAFQDWHDEAEDIYSFADGQPLTDNEV